MTNSSGAVVAEYTHDAYGNLAYMSGAQAADNPLCFSTKRVIIITASGLIIRLQEDGRDPIDENGGLNLYGFVGNSISSWVVKDGSLLAHNVPKVERFPGCYFQKGANLSGKFYTML